MIDFQNGSLIKLKPIDNNGYAPLIDPLLVEGEQVIAAFQAMRDGVVFTNKRIMSINIQGVTGKKKDITSMPYSKIQAFSVETAGMLDMDCELDLWFSSLGKVRFEFTGKIDVSVICRTISAFML